MKTTTMRVLSHRSILLAFPLTVLLLTGCVAAPIKRADITPTNFNVGRIHPQNIVVSTSFKCSPVENDFNTQMLRAAIVDGINSSGLFRQAASGGQADYQLDVSMLSLQQPDSGFTMRSSVEMLWTLTQVQDAKEVFRADVVSEYSQNAFNTFWGSIRWYNVMRGAIKKNVQEGIERLTQSRVLKEIIYLTNLGVK